MYKKENHSLARINKNLIATIGQWLLLNREIDQRLITMRINHLDTAKDLSGTKVYVFHQENIDSLVKKLNQHAHPLHQYIFQNLKIRRVPKIKFIACSLFSNEQKITRILDDLDEPS